MEPRLSLTIPVYNEQGNILPLVQAFKEARTGENPCPFELILVNNGSQDDSARELHQAKGDAEWIRILTVTPNRGYGGGIQAGLRAAHVAATHLGWMPADLQYSIEDLQKVWRGVEKQPHALHKGRRTERLDNSQSQLISRTYTRMAKQMLGLQIADVNGLPKIFPRALFERISFELASDFLLDGQICLVAQLLDYPTFEHEVTFHARRAGVSSWSRKRVLFYFKMTQKLWNLRRVSRAWFAR